MSVPVDITELEGLNNAVFQVIENQSLTDSTNLTDYTENTEQYAQNSQTEPVEQITNEGNVQIPLTYVTQSDVLDYHKKMMNIAISDAGRWCYGVKAIEVWLYNEDGNLESTEEGTWVDPIYFENEDSIIRSSLRDLYDRKSPRYKKLHRSSYAPGEGLPGVLWSDTGGNTFSSLSPALNHGNKIIWRNVEALAADPDQPYNPRLGIIAKAGFRRAAGVPFKVRGSEGIVVFMARESIIPSKLGTPLNEKYMIIATEHIGSVQALFDSRRQIAGERSAEARNSFYKARRLIRLALKFKDVSEDQSPEENHEKLTCIDALKETVRYYRYRIKKFMIRWSHKMCGANIAPPPSSPTNVSIFVLFAAFLTTFMMMIINSILKSNLGRNLGFEPGQIASVMVAVYTLTASPAAQPRNIILGRLVSMFVGMTFAHIPGSDPNLGKGDPFNSPIDWMRVSGAISFSAALMAKIGIPFPPGGSLSLIFLRYKWNERESYQKMGIIILQDSIFVVIASIFNNLHASRSYPTYWGFLPNMLSSNVKSIYRKLKE